MCEELGDQSNVGVVTMVERNGHGGNALCVGRWSAGPQLHVRGCGLLRIFHLLECALVEKLAMLINSVSILG